MKTKLLALTLVGLLGLKANAQTNSPPSDNLIGIDDCIIFAAGCVLFAAGYACWRNGWQRIWSDGTNATVVTSPPVEPPWDPGLGLDSVPHSKLRLNGAYAYALTNQLPYTNLIVFDEEATTDFVAWTNRLHFKVWESPVARLMLVSRPDGTPIWTNCAQRVGMGESANACPYVDPVATKPQEFFRLLSQ
jgi:hypothetical protein